MNLSSNTCQELETLAKTIQHWLSTYEANEAVFSKKIEFLTKKTQMEQALEAINVALNAQQTKKGNTPLHLQWRSEDSWNTASSPFSLSFWGAFPANNFDATKINTTATFTFGSQKVSGTVEQVQDWESKGYKCFGYKCEAVWPEDFLSGKVSVVINVSYKQLKDQLKRTFEVKGISPEGQAILDFLNGIEIKEELREEAWEYATEPGKKPDEFKTMDQLSPMQIKLKQLIKEIKAIQTTYENFAHKDSLKKLMRIGSEEFERTLFGGHSKVVWTEGCSAKLTLDHLERWEFPSKFEATYLTPLQNNLTAIEEKIKLIEEDLKKAEANYQNAKQVIEQKSKVGGTLLTQIFSITKLNRDFTTLKTNYPDLVDPDGTDAFLLLQKDKDTIQTIQDELNKIYTSYTTTCAALLETYDELYRGYSGKLRDKVLAGEAKDLKKAAKKAKEELPAKLELWVLEAKESLKFHAFIFEGIAPLLLQANAFYKAVTSKKGDFYRIKKDFGVIDISGSVPSIKAYNPDFRDKTGANQETSTTTTTYGHIEQTKLVDKNGINPEDVDQGGLGDCYFLSAVTSLAASSPEKIYGGEDAIIQGPNSKGEYTVKLYVPDAAGNPKRVSIQVEPSFVTKTVSKKNASISDSPQKSQVFAQQSKDKEMWPQLLEKALAQLEGSYSEITGGNKDMDLRGIEILTGKKINYHQLSSGIATPIQELIQIHNSTKKVPVAQFGTKSTLVADAKAAKEDDESKKLKPTSGENYILYKDRIRLYENHAYTLAKIKSTEAGKEVFILKNPHNDGGILEKRGGMEIEINRDQLKQYFDSIIITP